MKQEFTLIIPDVHGRTFWKDAVDRYPDTPVVFLGDYLDPYDNHIESISQAFAVRNMLEILCYKNLHPDRVTLLLGNHDLHYLIPGADCSRKDVWHAVERRQVFEQNYSHFRLAHCINTASTQVLFTHAGVQPEWMAKRMPDARLESAQGICDALNERIDDRGFLEQMLQDYSYYRGGCESFGSPIWADVREFDDPNALASMPDTIFQVFGHTQQRLDPVIRPRYACLDCRRAFLLTSDGVINEI